MCAGGGDLQASAFGGGDQFAAGAMHFDAQLADVFANLGAGFDDGLVHLMLDLLDDIRRSGGDELHYMRAELTGGRGNNLEFFFYADGKAVSHEGGPPSLVVGTAKRVSYASGSQNCTSEQWPTVSRTVSGNAP